MTPYEQDECDYETAVNTGESVEKVRAQLLTALTAAKLTTKGSQESASAWDIVEELEAELSHLNKRC